MRSGRRLPEGGGASERPRVGSGEELVFESAPALWVSFPRQRSVSENIGGSTRSVATTGGP